MNLFDVIDREERSNMTWSPKEPPCLDGIHEIELDTETDGLEWHEDKRPIGISIRLPNGKCQYIPWGHHGGGNLDEATVKRWAQRELRGKHITNINTRFDIHMLREWGCDLEEQGNTVGDVGHYAALLDDNRKRFSLDILGKDFLGRGKKNNNIVGAKIFEYHAGQIAEYAEEDVRLVGELKHVFRPLLDIQDLNRVKDLEDNLIYPVCEMEKNAAVIDQSLLKDWCVASESALDQCLLDIAKDTGFQMNPDKSSDWVRLFRLYNIPITHFTETGAPSFLDVFLKRIEHPTIKLARRAGKLASLRSKFLIAYSKVLDSHGLLRYSLHQLRMDDGGTVSGRFSCSNVNIQQVMAVAKQIEAFGSDEFLVRKLFIPANGLFLSADARQIEYRIFASYSGSPKILAAYAKDPDTDFHNIVMELVRQVKKDIQRKRTKDLNFAFIFGAGRSKMSEMLELPRNESDQLVDAYNRMFPEVPVLLRKASELAKVRGYVKTVMGRRARFPNGERAHKALNAVIQGSAADIMKTKLVELHKERKNTNLVLRFTVHDEVDGDVPDKESAEKVTEILNTQSFPGLKVPILWDVQTGHNWAECK